MLIVAIYGLPAVKPGAAETAKVVGTCSPTSADYVPGTAASVTSAAVKPAAANEAKWFGAFQGIQFFDFVDGAVTRCIAAIQMKSLQTDRKRDDPYFDSWLELSTLGFVEDGCRRALAWREAHSVRTATFHVANSAGSSVVLDYFINGLIAGGSPLGTADAYVSLDDGARGATNILKLRIPTFGTWTCGFGPSPSFSPAVWRQLRGVGLFLMR